MRLHPGSSWKSPPWICSSSFQIGMGVGCVIREFVEEELSNGTLLPFPMSEPIPPRKIGVALKGNVARNSPTDLLLSLLLS